MSSSSDEICGMLERKDFMRVNDEPRFDICPG